MTDLTTDPKVAKEFREKKREEDPQNKFVKSMDDNFVDTFRQVNDTVMNTFPECWDAVETCISVICALKVKGLINPIALILEGPPSSAKTTVLSFFYGIEGLTIKTDDFSPKSFVSHYANMKEEQLQENDLLPKICHNCFIIPELAPLFTKRNEDLQQCLGIFTRVLDGQGLETDSGVRGRRGYTGDYRFVLLGATTPLEYHVWNLMGRLGSRFIFQIIPPNEKSRSELIDDVMKKDFSQKTETCKNTIHKFLKGIFHDGKLNIEWNTERNDPKAEEFIATLAIIVTRLRAPIQMWGENGEEYSSPLIEEPERITAVLYDTARGRAVANERNYITMEDIPMIVRVATSTGPYDRSKVLSYLLKNEGRLNTTQVKEYLQCSERTAQRTMRLLELIQLVDIEYQEGNIGRPKQTIVLKKEFQWMLQLTHRQIHDGK